MHRTSLQAYQDRKLHSSVQAKGLFIMNRASKTLALIFEHCLLLPGLSNENACRPGHDSLLKVKVIYSRREARIDLCDFLLQNTTEFF